MTITPDSLRQFTEIAPPIDDVREEAARCCDETAKFERGLRPPLRMDASLLSEFTDAAAGTAAEVACTVGDAFIAAGVPFEAAFAWETAAMLLRNGWKRGDRLMGHVVGKEPAS